MCTTYLYIESALFLLKVSHFQFINFYKKNIDIILYILWSIHANGEGVHMHTCTHAQVLNTMLNDIARALLEADVNIKVVEGLVGRSVDGSGGRCWPVMHTAELHTHTYTRTRTRARARTRTHTHTNTRTREHAHAHAHAHAHTESVAAG